MSQVVARDAVAADQLVYPYPFPVGPAIDVSCGDDEVVVMCPSWAVAGLLGPGRHAYQSPDPSKPVAIYFVLTGPVEIPFDMVSQFSVPGTGAPVAVRATGSVIVRVADPGLLIAQFVGLPFDRVNDGLSSSVSSSVERLLGKVLPRKVAMAGSHKAVTDAGARVPLIDELTSYNPAVGAVYGVEFLRFATLEIISVGQNNFRPVEVSGWIGGKGTDSASEAEESTAKGPAPGIGSDPALMPPEAPPDVPPAVAEIPALPSGTRVLVALADGLLHAATVRQAAQGYYELEIGATGQTLWVPMTQVTPQL
jgi:hypothetical protein